MLASNKHGSKNRCHRFRSTFPPDWFASPFRPTQSPPDLRHWSEISDFESGDIKGIWEQNRFGFAFSLARAYASSHDECYAEAFWKAVEDWRQKNPPQCGPNWKCGQEIALRLMAWVFGYHAFSDAACTSTERRSLLAEMVDVSAKRIETNIGYALSQKNNHGISEATGLFTAGVVLGTTRWIERGRRLLEQQAQELIYDDGSFSQHSTNYHRVMLHDYLWAIQLGRFNSIEFSSELRGRVRWAGQWLLAFMDGSTGRVPNLGANDGALVFPLTDCDYLDFRPTLQAVGAILDGTAWLPAGPWDELALWLGAEWSTCEQAGERGKIRGVSEVGFDRGSLAHASGYSDPADRIGQADKQNPSPFGTGLPTSPKPPTEDLPSAGQPLSSACFTAAERCHYFPDGGYAILHDGETVAMFRCPQRFRHRPAHCDLLHFDLWLAGTNVL